MPQMVRRALDVKLRPVDSLVSEVLAWAIVGQALGHYRIEAKLGEGGGTLLRPGPVRRGGAALCAGAGDLGKSAGRRAPACGHSA